MSEAVAAFSLACNILQVIEYGSKILKRASWYHKSKHGLLVEHQELMTAATDLKSMSVDLSSNIDRAEGQQVPFLELKLRQCSDECILLSEEFMSIVDKYRVENTHDKLERLWKAFKATWNQQALEKLMDKLNTARANLHLVFLVYSQPQLKRMLSTTLEDSERRILDAITATLNKGHEINRSLMGLQEKLQGLSLKQAEKEFTEDARSFTRSSVEDSKFQDFEVLSDKISESAFEPWKERRKRFDDQHAVLETLYFEEIDHRHEQIADKHLNTLDWLLQPAPDHDASRNHLQAWLTSESAVDTAFWVSGKPGAGKSVLMRYLDYSLLQLPEFDKWTNGGNYSYASSFVWKPGSPIQRSPEGLLRNLLYQLLSQNPELIESVLPVKFTKLVHCDRSTEISWSLKILQQALSETISSITANSRVLILIDGLDELDGSRRQVEELLTSLRSSSSKPASLKLCLSSRPWNCFIDWFSTSPQLRLEDLTMSDIRRYADDKLQSNRQLREACRNQTVSIRKLANDIVRRAEGVFLWVYLVVEDLLRAAQDGETLRALERRLTQIPDDLDEYFVRIMESIEPQYRLEASALLQIALSKSLSRSSLTLSSRALYAVEASFVQEGKADFALTDDFEIEGDFNDISEMIYVKERVNRRINSRCMGLLETHKSHKTDDRYSEDHQQDHADYFGPKIDFLHRTLSDFLILPRGSAILHRFTHGAYDVELYQVNALLTTMKNLKPSFIIQNGTFSRSVLEVFASRDILGLFADIGKLMNRLPHLADKLANLLEVALSKWVAEWKELDWMTFQSDRSHHRCDPFIDYIMSEGAAKSQLPTIELAVIFGWVQVLRSRSIIPACYCAVRPLLDIALLPSQNATGEQTINWHSLSNGRLLPKLLVVTHLLQLGDCPNRPFRGRTVWARYLWFLKAEGRVDAPTAEVHRELCKILIKHGADKDLQWRWLLNNNQVDWALEQEDAQLPSPRAIGRVTQLWGPLPVCDSGTYATIDVLRTIPFFEPLHIEMFAEAMAHRQERLKRAHEMPDLMTLHDESGGHSPVSQKRPRHQP